MMLSALGGLDLLATAVVLVDEKDAIRYMNPAAENLFELSSQALQERPVSEIFAGESVIPAALAYARTHNCSYSEHDVPLEIAGQKGLHLSCTVTPVELGNEESGESCLIEFRPINRQLRIAREERLHDENVANRELVRNLAHEIKNPLGGIRGAAQLLERELDDPDLHEYTQVIMNEADRLQRLMDRLLTPHRIPQPALVSVHEVLERVRSVLLAEYHHDLAIVRDYDVSLPPVLGDREQLIQALLNIARNAAQALVEARKSAVAQEGVPEPYSEILFRTRAVRQVTLSRQRHRLAVEIQIIDNGPGIPEEICERIFYPLVSGHEGGSGLGLTLAQNFITQHHGAITFESAPGHTCFFILMPVSDHELPSTGATQ
jgi:two-component system, NtrC family, nitrogen regulation sensor histidine kinase GlnL